MTTAEKTQPRLKQRYRGEIRVTLLNTDSNQSYAVAVGDRIAQLVDRTRDVDDTHLIHHLDRADRRFRQRTASSRRIPRLHHHRADAERRRRRDASRDDLPDAAGRSQGQRPRKLATGRCGAGGLILGTAGDGSRSLARL